MTVAVVALAGLCFVLLIAFFRAEREHQDEREAWAQERRSLLDRIQYPEFRQVEPGETIIHEPPKDSAELAQVGLEVPEFVHVGDD